MKKENNSDSRIRIRYLTNNGKKVDPQQLLKGVLAALWDDRDKPQAMAAADWIAGAFNDNHVFFLPWALDANKARLLEDCTGGYEVFPWTTPDSEIYRFCESCRAWDFGDSKTLVKPISTRGSVAIFVCPACQHIAVDDVLAGKAGRTVSLTWRQLREQFGIDLEEMNRGKYMDRGICTLDVPATVAFYLDRLAPEGSFVGYWIDRTLAFVVLLIGREKGVPTFLKAVFPQTVGHWGHELWGPIFQTPDEMRKWMKEGLSDADEQMKSKVQSIMEGFDRENGGCHETRSCFRRNR